MSYQNIKGDTMTIEITKDKFNQFRKVQQAGLITMASIAMVMVNTDLTKKEVAEILINLKKYIDKYESPIVKP